MRFALMIEPQQGLTYDEQLAVARRAEAAGFETLFRSDHYESFPGATGEPTTDAWTVLAGLARDTTRIGLGTLVSPVTFRNPGNLAKVAITVDEMSGGRVEVGVGAGWHAAEHRRHGFPFPEIGERADMLEETLEVLRGLWDEPDGWSFIGEHFAIEDALFRPKPASLPARNGGPAAAHRRWRRVAALVPDRRPLRGRVQPVVVEPTGRHAEVRAARRDAAGGRPGPVDHRPLRDGRDADGPDDRRDPRPRVGRSCRRSGRRSRARRGSRRGAPAGSTARPTRRARRWPRSRRPGSSGSCSRTSFPGTSR